MKFIPSIFILLSFSSFELMAETPPRSPNYCGTMICVEIPFHDETNIFLSTFDMGLNPRQSKLEIEGSQGKVTIFVELIGRDIQCTRLRKLDLMYINGGLKGEAFIEVPSGDACAHVAFIFKSNIQGDKCTDLPITALWIVDEVPSAFWDKGYALRLGSQIDVALAGAK